MNPEKIKTLKEGSRTGTRAGKGVKAGVGVGGIREERRWR
jgi:hypothetical protein